jgi:membrane-bound ClpP family serine protease
VRRIEESKSMSPAVALLLHPLGAFGALMAAIVAGLYAAESRRALPALAATSAGFLALLAFLEVPPSAAGLCLLGAGLVLLHVEFLWATFGVAALLGICAATSSAWLLLDGLPSAARGGFALLGALALLAAVGHTMRRRTLPR